MSEPWLTSSVVLTCDACAGEFFPKPPGKCSDVGFDHPGNPHVALVHAGCEAGFIANGFDIEPADGESGPQLYCPHL
jgi:hypothetical protein